MADERRRGDSSENILSLDETEAQRQPYAVHGEAGREFKEAHPAPQIDIKGGTTRHEPLYILAQEPPSQHKPTFHKQSGSLDAAPIHRPASHAPHGHSEFLPAVHAGAKEGTKAASFWQPVNYIPGHVGLTTPVVTSPPDTATSLKPTPPAGIPPVTATRSVIPEYHQGQHKTATKFQHLPRDYDALEVQQLENRSGHPTLGHPLLEDPKDLHRHRAHHGHMTLEGNAHGGQEQLKIDSDWIAHQAAHAHPMQHQQQPLQTAPSGHHHVFAEGLHHPHNVPGPLPTVRTGVGHQDSLHHHGYSGGPMDAWADTDLIPPHAVNTDLVRRISKSPPRFLIDHFLGKARGPPRDSWHATMIACLRVAETGCLVFILLAIVLLCLAVFYTIGEYPVEVSGASPAKTDIVHMPTVLLPDTTDTDGSTDSLLERKLAAEPSTTSLHSKRARHAVSNYVSPRLAGRFTARQFDVKTVEPQSDSIDVITLRGADEDLMHSTETDAPTKHNSRHGPPLMKESTVN